MNNLSELEYLKVVNSRLRKANEYLIKACEVFEQNSADVTEIWEENRQLKKQVAELESKLEMERGQ